MVLLERLHRAAALAAGALALLAASQAEARWLKAESPHFVVYAEGDQQILRDYVERLEVFDAVLRYRHGPPASGPVRRLPIYVVSDDALRRVSPKLPRDVAGFYTAGEKDIFAVSRRERGSDRVVQHEYVHHFMLQYFPFAYPAWLTEGYAEYWMTTESDAKGVQIGTHTPARTSWLANAQWLPMIEVLRRRPGEFASAEARTMYYAQAWLLTHWFMGEPARRPKLVAYAQAVAGGADPAEALRTATGMTPEALQKTLRSYLNGALNFERWPLTQAAKPVIRVTALPPSADDLLLDAQRIKLSGADAELLARVRTLAARHPGDRLAELTRAHAEISGGDRAAGEAGLRRWLAGHPDDVEALELLAAALMKAAEDETDADRRKPLLQEARRHLGRASRVEPDRYQTLYAYARSFDGEPGEPTQATLEVWDRAQELAPQVTKLRLEFAGRLILKDDPKLDKVAATVLGPVLNHPHDTEAARYARDILALAREDPETVKRYVEEPARGDGRSR
jgi:hypothetical protein